MSWVEVDGAGWIWVHGLVIPLSIQLRSSRPELLCKKVFITLQNSQENMYAGVSLLIKLQACALYLYFKRVFGIVFSCEFYKIFKYTFFNEHNRWLLLSCPFFFKELPRKCKEKNTYSNINQRYISCRSRIQNSYNLLIFLAADGGWPSVTNFTLVQKVPIIIFI